MPVRIFHTLIEFDIFILSSILKCFGFEFVEWMEIRTEHVSPLLQPELLSLLFGHKEIH